MIIFKNKNDSFKKKGFTLPELLVVVAIIAILIASASTYLGQAKKKARDSKRLQDIQEIVKALHLYWSDNSHYPASADWETSADNPDQWLSGLIPYFGQKISVDPFNTKTDDPSLPGPRGNNYYYVYKRYDAPLTSCPEITKPFAIIGVKQFEDLVPADQRTADGPLPELITIPRAKCGELSENGFCTTDNLQAGKCMDWSQEFDYSVMLNE